MQVLETRLNGQNTFILHQTPPLTLWDEPVCYKAAVKTHGLGFLVTLRKTRDVVWPQLVMEEVSWIYADHHGFDDSDSQSKGLEVNAEGK